MSTKAIDRATARFTETMVTPAEKVVGAGTAIAAIKASPSWPLPGAADIQTLVGFWTTETANLSTGETLIAALEKQLATARSNQLATLRRWGLRRQGVLNAINVFCDGSKDTMTTFGVTVAGLVPHVGASVPVDLKSMKSKAPGIAGVKWYGTPENRAGFLVQHATNTADATTYSATVPSTKRSFKLPGQTPGATIYFRVLAVDPTLPGGQTAWTAWVAAVVSA
jgi:hypothetical protein